MIDQPMIANHPAIPESSAAMPLSEVQAGAVFAVRYPFVRDSFTLPEFDGEGYTEVTTPSWKPGCNYRPCAPDETEPYCHAEGQMELTVIDVHKPGKYPARVFFTRQWIGPDGKRFGKGALRIMTMQAFKRRAAGWFAEPYDIDPDDTSDHSADAGK